MSVTSTPLVGVLRKSIRWSIVLSVLMIVAGLLAILIPPLAGIAATIFFGWLLVFSGAMHLVFAWHTCATGGILWELLLGIVYIGVGIYLLLNPIAGLVSLTLGLAIYLLLEGLLELILSYWIRALPGSGWLLFDGIVTLILAVLIWRAWPASTAWAIGLLVGISMFFSGVSRLMLSLTVRRIVSRVA